MGNYYYLVAQLPFLKFKSKPPITRKKFLEEAEKWLSSEELNILRKIQFEKRPGVKRLPPVAESYYQFADRLTRELVAWRKARKRGTEHKISLFDPGIIKDGTPLDSEVELLRLRWKKLDELLAGFEFEFPVILIYYLKLQIVERLDSFDYDLGLEKYKHYTKVSL